MVLKEFQNYNAKILGVSIIFSNHWTFKNVLCVCVCVCAYTVVICV